MDNGTLVLGMLGGLLASQIIVGFYRVIDKIWQSEGKRNEKFEEYTKACASMMDE